MSRTLLPGATLDHYRVISPLGAGGMGEVWLAQDSRLERSVALKVLPPRVVQNEERLRRFVQEAKAASSLNHPHIVTIYEIGRAVPSFPEGTPGGGEPLHFIAMELVAGQTLRHEIHEARTELRTLLRYLAQVAEGLAKAHASGIVHRDLKPDNVMISKDGYAKVLDFGLAKLVERQGAEAASTGGATHSPTQTVEGMVLGTVGYMSPEQVRGKAVDHRSDVFSLGCLLYEAATRRRPFAADSDVETLHQILHDEPPSIDQLDPAPPAELRRLIRRCLAKSPEQRLQSMKDLAIELGEIVEEFDTLSTSAASRTAPSGAAVATAPRRLAGPLAGLAAVVLLGVAGLAFGVWSMLRDREPSDSAASAAFQSMRLAPVTSGGNVASAALSPDGRYLAYLVDGGEQRSLRVRQIATGSDVEILPAQDPDRLRALSFSPDGDYLHYLGRDQENPIYSSLYRVASLGGTPQRILFDVDSGVAFSPDGASLAFMRGYPQAQESALMVADADGRGERRLAVVPAPDRILEQAPSWSSDGSRIAAVVQRLTGGLRHEVAVFDVRDGGMRAVGGRRFLNLGSVTWLPDGRSMLVTGVSFSDPTSRQVWRMDYPGGDVRRVTNDLNSYFDAGVSRDGSTLAAIAARREARMWAVPLEGGSPRAIAMGGALENSFNLFATLPDGAVVVDAPVERGAHLWLLDRNGARRQITTGPGFNFGPRTAPGSGVIVYGSAGEDGVLHIYRLEPEAGDPIRLTDGAGEVLQDVSRDGGTVLFSRVDAPGELWAVRVAGGAPWRIASSSSGGASGISPDGSRVCYSVLEERAGRLQPIALVVPLEGGAATHRVEIPPGSLLPRWTPDGDGIAYLREDGGTDEVWRIDLEGGAPRRLTNLRSGRTAAFAWSRDGSRILAVRFVDGAWNLWSIPLAGGPPRPLTDFRSGQIFDFGSSSDGREIVVVQGEAKRDAVLITGFR